MIASLLRRASLLALLIGCALSGALNIACAQNIVFETRSPDGSPVALATANSPPWRAGAGRRIFVTVANKSEKAIAAVTLEQTISAGAKTRIVALERASIVIMPRQKKSVSVSVEDILERIKSAAASGEDVANPTLTGVAVEFLDGTLWNAP